MVLLELFLLAGIDQSINPKSKQTIGKRVKVGFTDRELKKLKTPIGEKNSGLDFKFTKDGGFSF